jgi:hypothetical protein
MGPRTIRIIAPVAFCIALTLITFASSATAQTVRYSVDDPFLYLKEERLRELIHKLKERKAIELLLGEGVEARARQAASARLYFPRRYPGLVLPGYVDAVKIEYSESGEIVHLRFTTVLKSSDGPEGSPPAEKTRDEKPSGENTSSEHHKKNPNAKQ